MPDSGLSKQIYTATKDNKFSLHNAAIKLTERIGIDLNDYNFDDGKSLKRFSKHYKDQLHFNHEEEWFNYMLSPVGKSGQGNKLRTYVKFKRTLDCENYLSFVENVSHRTSLTKLRISAHPL